jgi:DNA-binding LacI/PurR family transcriptional regulator
MGVSRTTVSNAFNRPAQLSESLREDVLAKAREMGYFGPQLVARAMRRHEVREVGVVFHHDLSWALDDASTIETLRGVASELDPRHLTLQVIPKMGRKLSLAAAFQTTADALIVHAEIGPEFAPELKASDRPLVLIDAVVPGIPAVRVADKAGAAAAMAHALSRRPDRIVIPSFPVADDDVADALRQRTRPTRGWVGTERLLGYLKSLREAGFPMERVTLLRVDDAQPATATARMASVRASLPTGTRLAIVAMSDRLALASLLVARRWRGIEIVAAVGFDDIPGAAAAGLTTVRQDLFGKGKLAVRVLLDGAKPAVLPVELVVRST